eukprot:2727481-Rhodomonas_salina.1
MLFAGARGICCCLRATGVAKVAVCPMFVIRSKRLPCAARDLARSSILPLRVAELQPARHEQQGGRASPTHAQPLRIRGCLSLGDAQQSHGAGESTKRGLHLVGPKGTALGLGKGPVLRWNSTLLQNRELALKLAEWRYQTPNLWLGSPWCRSPVAIAGPPATGS